MYGPDYTWTEDDARQAEIEQHNEDVACSVEKALAALLERHALNEHDVREAVGLVEADWRSLLDDPIFAPTPHLQEFAKVVGVDYDLLSSGRF